MSNENTGWKKRESFSQALVQIVVVGAILGGAVFFFYKRADTRKRVDELVKEARVTAIKSNPADLKKALGVVEQALDVDSSSADANALAAALHTQLWLEHKEAASEAKAKDYLAKAKSADAKSEDRYGTEALLLLAAGDPKKADEFVEDLRKQGASKGRLFYAQGLAQWREGNLSLATTSLRTAIDKAWKDPTYPATLGEMLVEQGATGAVDAFSKSLGANSDYFRGRLGMALVRIMKKDRVGDAETMIRDVLSRDAELSPPLKARALALNAAIAVIAEQPDAAMQLADQALALNADEVWALFAKANALALKKDPGAAGAYDALVAKAKTTPVFYFEGASRLLKAGSLDAALALLNKYEELFKTVKNQSADGKEVAYLDRDDVYWLTRGEVLREAKKEDDALAAFDKAIEAKSIHIAKAYFAKGSLLVARKDYDKAAEVLQDITPPDGSGQLPEAYMAMGELQFAKKMWPEGCQSYAFALSKKKMLQAPREELNALLTDVEKALKTSGQGPMAKQWMEEAKPLIQ